MFDEQPSASNQVKCSKFDKWLESQQVEDEDEPEAQLTIPDTSKVD